MKGISRSPLRVVDHPVVLGVAVAGLYWIADSVADALLLHDVSLLPRMFPREPSELLSRFLVVCALLALSLYVRVNSAERRGMGAALRESEEQYRSLFESAGDVIFSLDAESHILSISPSLGPNLGYAPEELVGRPLPELGILTPESLERALADVKRVFSGEGIQEEYEFIAKNGSRLFAAVGGYPSYREGKIVQLVGVARDTTERRRAEEVLRQAHAELERRVVERTAELEAANRHLEQEIAERQRAEEERRRLEAEVLHAQKLESLGLLAGGAAHDFNNLLAGILGNVGLALRRLSPESAARGDITRVEEAVLRATELTNQMLTYSGRGQFVVQPLDLSKLVEAMADLLEVSISKKVTLRYDFAQGLPAVEADAAQMQQLIMNLITNASEAIGDAPGLIIISTGVVQADRALLADTYLGGNLPEGRYVYLEVSDSGCGMDEVTLVRMFDPFFSTKPGGRGLGLAAVESIVRGHEGAIKLVTKPGSGTTFRVLLPATDQPAREVRPQGSTITEEWRGSGTILVVDDEPAVLYAAQQILEEFGFTVLTAADGRAGVRIFREHADEIAAVLLDMTMPEMDGQETFREIRRLRGEVRVILTSGYTEQDVASRLAGEGLAEFIQKPYRMEALVAKVRQVLEG